jgi:hypothetical protein
MGYLVGMHVAEMLATSQTRSQLVRLEGPFLLHAVAQALRRLAGGGNSCR